MGAGSEKSAYSYRYFILWPIPRTNIIVLKKISAVLVKFVAVFSSRF